MAPPFARAEKNTRINDAERAICSLIQETKKRWVLFRKWRKIAQISPE